MKLLRFGEVGREKPGLVDRDGRIRDVSSRIDDVAGRFLDRDALKKLAALDPAGLPLVDGQPRLGTN